MMGSLRIQSFHKTKILKLCPHQFGAINGQAKTFSSLVDEDYSKETRSSTSKVRLKPPWNVMFFGTDDFAVESLQALCKGRERKLIGKLDVITAPVKKTSPVLQFCKKENIQVIQWSAEVPKGTYDVGTVVSFGHLLPLAIIDAFPMFDVGRILRTAAVPIPWDIKSGALTKQLATLGARELIQVIESLPEVLEKAVEQSGKGVTKAPKVSENSSRIKWNTHTCRNIQARYRALDDYIPLWTTWQGIPVKLRKMEMHKEWSYPAESNGSDNFVSENKISRDSLSEKEVRNSSDSVICNKINLKDNVKPGTAVYDRTTKTVNVKCLDHWVSFSQVLLKGRKPMSAHEFYNGFMSKYPNKQLEFC
ncbi:methionyl-tRNA formyltransferase, mitochondrial isoform X2 [Palaemon carinicauda]|uniref:methionyl-tRNA formyltransferase, mitochondrial isoform X2 n=1 Tax=Palaemon carinicauda TaxID=392227 RepID=UPI0035B5FC98